MKCLLLADEYVLQQQYEPEVTYHHITPTLSLERLLRSLSGGSYGEPNQN